MSDKGVISERETFPLSSTWSTQEWPADTVVWGYYPLDTRPSLPTDTYTITLALMNAATEMMEGQPVVAGQVIASPSPCKFPVLQDAVSVNGLFGDDLRLSGYQLNRSGAHLGLTLHWRSERRMAVDYKIFVHVFDPATGVPVAQDDAMPHRWAYPTTFWSAGDEVDDLIPISLKDIPPGTYGVAVGVYDPATGERLPVLDETGHLLPDGRLVLPGETISLEE